MKNFSNLLLLALGSLPAVGCGASPPGGPAEQAAEREDPVRQTGPGLTMLQVASNTLSVATAWSDGTPVGAWWYSHDNVAGAVADYDLDGRSDIVLRSGWGLGIAKYDLASSGFTTMTMVPSGSVLGGTSPGWTYKATDRILGAGKFSGNKANGLNAPIPYAPAIVVRSESRLGLLVPSGSSLSLLASAPIGSFVGGWRLGADDQLVAVGNFDGNLRGKVQFVLKSGWGLGVIGVDESGRGLTCIGTIPFGTELGSTDLGSVWLGQTDTYVGAIDLDGGGDELIVQQRTASATGTTPYAITALHRVNGAFSASATLKNGTLLGGVGYLSPNGRAIAVARNFDGTGSSRVLAAAQVNSNGAHVDGLAILGPGPNGPLSLIASHAWTDFGTNWNNDDDFGVLPDMNRDGLPDLLVQSRWGVGVIGMTWNGWSFAPRRHAFVPFDDNAWLPVDGRSPSRLPLVSAGTFMDPSHGILLLQNPAARISEPSSLYSRLASLNTSLQQRFPGQFQYSTQQMPRWSSFTLAADQTPTKLDNGPGDCATFSYLAAVEALYNRKYPTSARNLDLSEEHRINQYLGAAPLGDFGEVEFTVPLESARRFINFPNQTALRKGKPIDCSLAERTPPASGSLSWDFVLRNSWGTDAVNHYWSTGWSLYFDPAKSPAADWLRDSVAFSDVLIPAAARSGARFGGRGRFDLNVSDTTLLDDGTPKIDGKTGEAAIIKLIEHTIRNGREVLVSLDVDITKEDGTKSTAGHAIVLYGFDAFRRVFHVKNSWGTDQSLDTITYDWLLGPSFTRPQRLRRASFILDVIPPSTPTPPQAVLPGVWEISQSGPFSISGGYLVIRRNDVTGTALVNLGHYYAYAPDGGSPVATSVFRGRIAADGTVVGTFGDTPKSITLRPSLASPDTITGTVDRGTSGNVALRLDRVKTPPVFPQASGTLPVCR